MRENRRLERVEFSNYYWKKKGRQISKQEEKVKIGTGTCTDCGPDGGEEEVRTGRRGHIYFLKDLVTAHSDQCATSF
jgi:hypothetical protein